MRKMRFFVLYTQLLLVALYMRESFAQSARNARLQLVQGKYQNILIAIKEDIEEKGNEKLVQRLKDEFSRASSVLYEATKRSQDTAGYAFGNITILVPKSWSQKAEYQLATWQNFETADIRVASANPLYGNNPYTEQPGGCGQQGSFVHFTPEYFTDSSTSIYRFGVYENLIVHEWSHYRYGLFDEYPVENFPHFYLKNGRLVPVRCTEQVTGQPRNYKTLGRCQVDRVKNEPEPDCRFFPDLDQTGIQASMTGYSFLKSSVHFCDNSTNSAHKHNVDAPNKHNRMCNFQSAWEVLRQHEDFKTFGPRQIVTTPNFIVVKRPTSRDVVLVLDYSGSMNANDFIPIRKLRQALTRFVLHDLEDTVRLGIVIFNSNVFTTGPLTLLNSSEIRNKKINEFVDIKPKGLTALGDGLMKGFELLRGDPFKPSEYKGQGYLFLVSDGMETTSENFNFSQALSILKQSSVKVDVLALGSETGDDLAELAESTGGKLYFSSSTNPSPDFISAMTDSVSLHVDAKDRPLTMVSRAFNLSDSVIETKIIIDNDLGRQTVFSFSYNTDRELNVTAISPSKKIYSGVQNAKVKLIEVAIDDVAEKGEWTILIKNSVASPYSSSMTDIVSLIATSKPKLSDGKYDVVTAEAYLDTLTIKNMTADTRVKAFVNVFRGVVPVLNAKVKMVLSRPLGTSVEIDMFDNGSGSDSTANDGIYTAYVTARQLNGEGEYSIAAVVTGVPGQVKIPVRTQTTRSGAPPTNWDYDANEEVKTKDLDGFRRDTVAGKFRLINYDASVNSVDRVPPDEISDLKAEVIRKNTVSLYWTAVGDDGDQGTAQIYDIRSSTNSQSLRNNFNNSSKCCNSSADMFGMKIIKGSLVPKTSSSKENLVIEINRNVPGQGRQLYFSVAAVDKAGNRGKPAQPFSVTFVEPTFVDTSSKVSFSLTAGAIAGIVIGVLLLFIIFAVVLKILKCFS